MPLSDSKSLNMTPALHLHYTIIPVRLRLRAFHTMVYVEELDTAYVFGGLIWKSQTPKCPSRFIEIHLCGLSFLKWRETPSQHRGFELHCLEVYYRLG